MNTTCYCIGCKKHPLHDIRNDKEKARWVHHSPWEPEEKAMDRDVDCLKIESRAFDEDVILGDPEDYEWEEVWYGDGDSYTETEPNPAVTIRAVCGNEEHEE
jgi:hypothetical protein